MKLRDTTRIAVERILDAFSGADGGGQFMNFRCLIEDMDAKAAEGDEAAENLVDVVMRFARLLQSADKWYGPKGADPARGL